jgi:hypothetical protein
MIGIVLRIVLLVFALIGFAGTGASLAVGRYRHLMDGERDLGMLGVACMLFVFGALCTAVGTGIAGVLAFGGIALWASYVLMAQHLGIFHVEVNGRPRAEQESTRAGAASD